MSTFKHNSSINGGTRTPVFNGKVLLEAERIIAISSKGNSLHGDFETHANGLVLAPEVDA
jgi:hypothetical protein